VKADHAVVVMFRAALAGIVSDEGSDKAPGRRALAEVLYNVLVEQGAAARLVRRSDPSSA